MKKFLSVMLIIIACFSLFSGCNEKNNQPINLKIWHVYGGQTDSPLNDLINEFNRTVGKERNIQVNVTMVSNTNKIHKAVIASANKAPGTTDLPDIFVSYPKTVLALPNQDMILDFNQYFSQEEKDKFIPQFLDEGMVEGKLNVIPLAKSSEMLFINKTFLEKYIKRQNELLSIDKQLKIENIQTWEGLFEMAEMYSRYTDEIYTPQIKNDPKTFFVHDYMFHYFQVGMKSLGKQFFKNDIINFDETFKMMFDKLSNASCEGGVWLKQNFGTEPLRTGDCFAVVASSASVLYFSNTVTKPDNTDVNVELLALPAPYFKNGNKIAVQRGAGLCVTKSTKEREDAAVKFIKWLLEPQRNTQFVTKTGYMPVTKEAMDVYLPKELEVLDKNFGNDEKSKLKCKMYKSVYNALYNTYKNYEFFIPPQFDRYLALEDEFESNIRLFLAEAKKTYLNSDKKLNKQDITDDIFLKFQNSLETQRSGIES